MTLVPWAHTLNTLLPGKGWPCDPTRYQTFSSHRVKNMSKYLSFPRVKKLLKLDDPGSMGTYTQHTTFRKNFDPTGNPRHSLHKGLQIQMLTPLSRSLWSLMTLASASTTRDLSLSISSWSPSSFLVFKPLLCSISRSFLMLSSLAVNVCFCVSILSSISSRVLRRRNT